jgi:hypothetical protein
MSTLAELKQRLRSSNVSLSDIGQAVALLLEGNQQNITTQQEV